jgi:acyl-coenzyme A thioesterase PaaI-like protein
LHGGASVALAESVGSAASFLYVNTEISEVRNRNLCKSSKSETKWYRYSHCSNCPSRKSIHLWEIRITDENENLISICKLTNMILPKEKRE